jgi:hypothetical protein
MESGNWESAGSGSPGSLPCVIPQVIIRETLESGYRFMK